MRNKTSVPASITVLKFSERTSERICITNKDFIPGDDKCMIELFHKVIKDSSKKFGKKN